MNRFAFLTLYRSLIRHKLYGALNVGGLAVGIAVFLVLGLYVRFETSYETWLPHHDQVYLVQTNWHLGGPADGTWPQTMGGLLEQMREDFPGLTGTRIRGGAGDGSVRRGGVAVTESVSEVDASFADVFELPMVRGDAHALVDPGSMLISETAARKYFGESDPLGQTLTVAIDTPHDYHVAGVFKDLPKNTELGFAILLPMPKVAPEDNWYHWGSTSLYTYLRFATPGQARTFEQSLAPFADRRGFKDIGKDASKSVGLSLLPFAAEHLQPLGQEAASRKITVVSLGVVGLLTLIIAMVNYVNLATARAGLRAREVAVRKVLGADRSALIRQFLGEAVLTVAVAALLGLSLAELGLPFVNAAGGLSLTIPYLVVLPGLIVLALLVGVSAGFYPAVLLSSVSTAAVLASARAPGGGRAGTRMREVLVVIQFGLATGFLIGTCVLVAQTRHVRHTDLGFRREGLLVVPSVRDAVQLAGPGPTRSVLAAIAKVPGVTSVGIGNQMAGDSGSQNADNVPLPGVAGDGPSLRWIEVGRGFFEAYGTKPIAGRLFDDAHGGDEGDHRTKGQPLAIVINRKAVPVLGFKSPADAVNKTVGGTAPRTIIGVVDDLRFFSPRSPTAPTYYRYTRDLTMDPVASIRFTGDPRATLDQVRSVWRRMLPEVPFDGDLATKRLDAFYEADDRATRLFGIGAALAVMIGCIGLWGLASFNTERRLKEIGIRKTLGATSSDIVRLLVGQFLRPVLFSNLVAWPLAFFAMRTWLSGFDDRIVLSPLYFVGGSLITVLIAALTVAGQSLGASRVAPAWAMRYE